MKYFIPAAVWLVAVTALSLSPNVTLPKFDLLAPDKVGHAAAYGFLNFLLLLALKKWNHPQWNGNKAWLAALLFSISWGGLMEICQATLVPNRMAEWDDMIANIFGALVVGWFFRKKF